MTLWDHQDWLISGKFGAIENRKPLTLETPARVMKGKKQRNPSWDVLAEWAYFKAPTTRSHEFSPYIHNWTAGELYHGEVPAC